MTRQAYTAYEHRIVIDNAATFLNWAKRVQSDLAGRTRPKCDYQDDYARTPQATIDQAFNDATPDERRTILCAVYNTMDYNEVERLLLVRAKAVRHQELTAAYAELDKMQNHRTAELDRREAAIADREQTFKSMMKPYHRRLADQRRTINRLQAQLTEQTNRADAIRLQREHYKHTALEYEIKAAKYDAIREALAL